MESYTVREQLITAGIVELEAHGMADFSLRRVAAACNLSCAAPYKHFKGKEDLIEAIFAHIHTQLELLLRQIRQVHPDPKEQLVESCLAYIRFCIANPHFRAILMLSGRRLPLADTVEKCKEAEQIVAAHPELIFMLGFMRRYDHSYAVAKKKIDNGDIGDIILVRCYSQDPISIIEGTLEYAPRSGGQFIDMSIHDIDLIRWLTNSEPRNLWAIGGCYEFKQYKDWDDGDNVSCLMQCENDAMAFFFAGRAAAHGSHVETEIVGTRGTLRIAAVPTDSRVEVMSEHGVCRECYQDFITRWHDAYITEMEEFCDCVANNRKATPGVIDGTQSTKIAFRCKESFLANKMLPLE